MDMTKGNTTKLILKFAFPLMIGNILQQFYNLADAMIVGKILGYKALAALGSADWLVWFMNSVINGLTMGFCAKASQEKGKGEQKSLFFVSAMCIFLAVIFSGILFITGQIMAMPALKILNTPSDIINQSYNYLHIIYLGLPVNLFFNTFSALLRADGDSKTPFVAMLISSVVNVGMDSLFVIKLNLGVESAAIATVFAQFCALIFCMIKFLRTKTLRFPKEYFKPISSVIKSILKQALPIGFQFCIISLSGLIIQVLINRQGATFIAGYTAANKYYGMMEMAAIAIASAMLTYSGQNYGARQYTRIKNGIKSSLIICAIISSIVTLIMIVFGKPLLSLFISAKPPEKGLIENFAYQFLLFLSCPLFILYVHHALRSILQGVGDIMTPIMSGVVQLIFRVGGGFIFTYLLGSVGVFICEPCAWIGSVTFLSIRLRFFMKRTKKEFNI